MAVFVTHDLKRSFYASPTKKETKQKTKQKNQNETNSSDSHQIPRSVDKCSTNDYLQQTIKY